MSTMYPRRGTLITAHSRTTPKFLLTHSVPVKVIRQLPGELVRGRWVDSSEEIEIDANVQPMKGFELMSLPEADRTKESIKVYSVERLRTVEEVDQTHADIIVWEGKRYRAIRTMTYSMSVLDHTKTICYRLPETPDDEATYAKE